MQVISVIPCDFGIFSDAFGEFTGRIVTVSSVSSFAGYWIKSKSPGKRTTSLKNKFNVALVPQSTDPLVF